MLEESRHRAGLRIGHVSRSQRLTVPYPGSVVCTTYVSPVTQLLGLSKWLLLAIC